MRDGENDGRTDGWTDGQSLLQSFFLKLKREHEIVFHVLLLYLYHLLPHSLFPCRYLLTEIIPPITPSYLWPVSPFNDDNQIVSSLLWTTAVRVSYRDSMCIYDSACVYACALWMMRSWTPLFTSEWWSACLSFRLSVSEIPAQKVIILYQRSGPTARVWYRRVFVPHLALF